MMALYVAAAAFGQCEDAPALAEPPEALSVAWVSPMGRRARGRAWLYVVPTAELRTWAATEGRGDVARTLQWLGVRRSGKQPRRLYKVVVFDTHRESLCRPVFSDETHLVGVPTCDDNHAGPDGAYEGCGWATDRGTGQPTIPMYRAQWSALAVNGFCLLPLSRFMEP